MRSGANMLVFLLGVAVLAPTGHAAVTDSPLAGDAAAADVGSDQPYSAIWVRNVFDLTPKPPAVVPTNNTAPPPNIKLMGIYTLFGKRAILGVQEPSRPGQPPAKEESFTMTEGDRRSGIEVLEIDPASRTVKIKNEENISTLAMETNKPAGGQMAGGAAPGAPGTPHPFKGFPAFAQAGTPANPAAGTQLPPRNFHPYGNAYGQAQGATAQPNYQANYANYLGGGYTPGTGAAPGASAGLSLPGNNGGVNNGQANAATQPSQATDPTAALRAALEAQAAASSGKLYPPPPPPSTPIPAPPPGVGGGQ